MHTTAMKSTLFIGSSIGAMSCPASAGAGLKQRLVHLVESTDWDQRFLRKEKWFNRICAAIMAFSVLYMTPFMLAQLLK
jgi:hypothetical protein